MLSVNYDGGAGTVTATYAKFQGYTMRETHFYVGAKPLPTDNNGAYSVAPGQYTDLHDPLADVSLDTFTVSGVSGAVYVVAHAVVCGGTARRHLQTADGCKCVCPTSPPTSPPTNAPVASGGKGKRELEAESEAESKAAAEAAAAAANVKCVSAFGYHSSKKSSSFEDLGIAPHAHDGSDITWGWTNGPLEKSNYAYSMDMVIKSPDTSHAVVVGAVTVGYDGEEAVVTLETNAKLWLKEVHAYVGTSRLPVSDDGMEVIDPTQHPVVNRRMSMSRTFVVSELTGEPVYVVAHATVCGVFEEFQKAEHASIRGRQEDKKQEGQGGFFRKFF